MACSQKGLRKAELGFSVQGLNIAMESLSLESQDMIYKPIAGLDHAQFELPWAKEIYRDV